MRQGCKFFLAALLLAVPSSAGDVKPSVSIRVSPQTFLIGSINRKHPMVVTCTVPRHEANRRVIAHLGDFTQSERQIDGLDSFVTFRFEFTQVPCDVAVAACELHAQGFPYVIATTPITIAGCEQ